MFTGLVEATGTVDAVERDSRGLELVIRAPLANLQVGESIAVDGACLTVTAAGSGTFRVHVVETSLPRTGFAEYAAGRRVNLERSLRLGDRLGGHLVQGHVDGVGMVERVEDQGDARLLDIRMPPGVAAVTLHLGSIAVDGVSLTVNALPRPDVVQVSVIPHSLAATTLGDRKPGDRIHLEGDMLARWVKQLMAKGTA
jgi:riboflavin synthase